MIASGCTACPGYCGAQDTFYVGNLKGVGRVYQQTFIDTYAKVGFAKLYDRKTPITAADLLNDRVIPFYEEHGIPLQRVLTDRGTEYCGTHDRHEYELYLAVENIDHTRTKTKSPQTNGIVERFHKTLLDEFYRIAFRKKVYDTIGELQADLDLWIDEYNQARTHQGRYCFGKTPMQTFLDATPLELPPIFLDTDLSDRRQLMRLWAGRAGGARPRCPQARVSRRRRDVRVGRWGRASAGA